MKIIAIILTCTLLGVMAWMVVDARSDAKGMRNQIDLLRKQQQPGPAAVAPDTHTVPGVAESDVIKGREQQILQEQMGRSQPGGVAPGAPLGRAPVVPPAQNYGGGTAMTPAGSTPSPALANALNAAAAAPLPQTPRQRMVAAAPVLARVTEVQVEAGFVVINAGANRKLEKDMTFAIRRAGFIIGQIKVMETSPEGSVANITEGSVPAGVGLEVGDDVIQDLPPGA